MKLSLMSAVRSRHALHRTASEDLWENTLSQIQSMFGRLVYLSSLRNPNTARYEHHGLSLVFNEEEASRALKTAHSQVFDQWVQSNLKEQKADLDLYLSPFNDKRNVLDTWLRLSPYRNLLPSSVRGVERKVYLSDLETLLQLLRNEYGVDALDQDA